MNGEIPDSLIDHKNCNRSDNRWDNLRLATNVENAHNRLIPITNKTRVKGVWYDKNKNKYTAYITSEKVRYHLGTFNSLEEAKRIRNNKTIEFHRNFARI
jgi:hypothetical protein